MWFTDYIKLMLGTLLQSIFLCLDLEGYICITTRGTYLGQVKTKGLFVATIWFFTWLEELTRQSLHFTCWIKMFKDLFPKYLRSQLQGLEVLLSLQSRLVGSRLAKSFFTIEQHRKFHDYIVLTLLMTTSISSLEVMEHKIHLILSWANFAG